MRRKCLKIFLLSASIVLCGCSERMTDNAKQPVKKTVNQDQIEKKILRQFLEKHQNRKQR